MKAFLRKHREILLYLVFGVLTTLVGFGTYFAILFSARLCGVTEGNAAYNVVRGAAQVIQWVLAVLFAYVTNKKFVFAYEGGEVRTLVAFAGARLFSLLADSAVTFGTIAVLTAARFVAPTLTLVGGISITVSSDLVGKTLAAVVVIILNYILSKWLVFRTKNER